MQYNLEQEMYDALWFKEKVRASESYAQNLYAALCNNAFQKLEVMPILKDEAWTCSWRYAGSIVATIRVEGDYLDWYCSGIKGTDLNSEYVGESYVTDEIREDLKRLGWGVIDDYYGEML